MPSKTSIHMFCAAIIFAIAVSAIASPAYCTVTSSFFSGALPGIEPFDKKLVKKFKRMKAYRGNDYHPRTRHLRSDGWAKYTNRLFLESSPYLVQHAHNPVNWYPWGTEAFEAAKSMDRPILLSVGYSTCHWCHVMEEESFEDKEIARYINENYIAIKVDREERPDIDAIYMNAVIAMTGSGGWPMTVWLTQDKKPFFGGTYFPARDGDRGVQNGFLTLLKRINEIYKDQPERVEEFGEKLAGVIQQRLRPAAGEHMPTANTMSQAIGHYKRLYDPENGGIKGAPKFPSSLPVRFLLRYYRRTGDQAILTMAEHTLGKMAAGGIYDQIGGGFHRYATDSYWLVPHFEKMLYDNALLIMAYLEGYQVTGAADFKRIVIEMLRYVKRDMTSPQGAFYSATDADSLSPGGDREEGYFFTWLPEDLDNVLGKDRSAAIRAYYAMGAAGNFEGRHILHVPKPVDQIAQSRKITTDQLRTIIEDSKALLYQHRSRRPPPLRDEKILTAWNGLMISAHARAGLILGESRYTKRAARAAQFILDNLFIRKRLYRSYKDNHAKHNAYLDDYAFFIAGLLDLYEATQEIMWLKKAIQLDGILKKYYQDKTGGGFYMTSSDHEKLLVRGKPGYDGAEPSGNSVAILNLLRLSEFTFKDDYRKRAENALKSFLGGAESNPVALSEMLLSLDFYLDAAKEIVIVSPKGKPHEAEPFLRAFRKQFLPNRILIVAGVGKELDAIAKIVPVARGKAALGGKATAYVCEKGNCKLPAKNPTLFSEQIKSVKKLTLDSNK